MSRRLETMPVTGRTSREVSKSMSKSLKSLESLDTVYDVVDAIGQLFHLLPRNKYLKKTAQLGYLLQIIYAVWKLVKTIQALRQDDVNLKYRRLQELGYIVSIMIAMDEASRRRARKERPGFDWFCPAEGIFIMTKPFSLINPAKFGGPIEMVKAATQVADETESYVINPDSFQKLEEPAIHSDAVLFGAFKKSIIILFTLRNGGGKFALVSPTVITGHNEEWTLLPHIDCELEHGELVKRLVDAHLGDIDGKSVFVKEGDYQDIYWHIRPKEPVEFYCKQRVDELSKLVGAALEKKQKLVILLYGPPGTGKSSVIKALNQLHTDLTPVVIDKNIRELDSIAPIKEMDLKSKVLVLEDINLSAEDPHSLQFLMHLLDSDFADVVFITSNTSKLPAALVRSGRVDLKRKVGLPKPPEILEIIDNLAEFYNVNLMPEGIATLKAKVIKHGFTPADMRSYFNYVSLCDETPDRAFDIFLHDKQQFEEYEDDSYGIDW